MIGGIAGQIAGVEDLVGGDENNTFLGDAGDNLFSAYYDRSDGGGDNLLDGRGGNDSLGGASGQDTLRGGDGRDTLRGFGDADTLDGGAGNDLLEGGSEDDRITGGAGADRFRVNFGGNGDGAEASGTDVITDYDGAAGDRLAISVFDIDEQASIAGRDLFRLLDTNDNGRLDNADGAVEFANATLDFTVAGGKTTLMLRRPTRPTGATRS